MTTRIWNVKPLRAAFILLLLFGVGCEKSPKTSALMQPKQWELLAPEWAHHWKAAGIPEEGAVTVKEGEIQMAMGKPMTGATFADWQALKLPMTGYRVSYEAMRVEGEDFFGTVTFPVGNLETHASLVIGGWGGTLVGISSIDYSDASENQTRSEQQFENGRWYRVTLEVRPDELKAWIDDKIVVNVNIKARRIGLRGGEIEKCRPFGFATYLATGRVRKVVVVGL